MKLLDRYEFTNGAAFETKHLEDGDAERYELPECDVIGFCRVQENGIAVTTYMRPDEALIQARMLIDAVQRVTEGYTIGLKSDDDNLKDLYPKYKCPQCGDWFHLPYKFCKCKSTESDPKVVQDVKM